jgi:hypothetical protein
MGKVYEKVVLSGITKMLYIIGMTFPDPLQFGFVPEHGSILALYTLNECINFSGIANRSFLFVFSIIKKPLIKYGMTDFFSN